MKHTFLLLATLSAMMTATPAWAYKETAQDTVKVNMQLGFTLDYTSIGSIDFLNNGFVLNSYDGKSYDFSWSMVSSLDFASRYSNGEMLVSNAYYGLYAGVSQPLSSYLMVSLLASDETLGSGGVADYENQAFDFLCQYRPDQFRTFWNVRYEAIEDCNLALQRLPLTTRYSREYRDHLTGEAYFLRGYYYYELATMFNSIPVYTNNDELYKLLPQDPDRVWARIFADLIEAVTYMDRSVESGRDDKFVRKSAAEAMLARAYLFYLGYYKGVHDIAAATEQECMVVLPGNVQLTRQLVIGCLQDCVLRGGNALHRDYRNLWAYTNRLTVEDYAYTAGQGLKWVDDDAIYTGKGDVVETLFKIKHVEGASWNYNDLGYCNQIALYTGLRSGLYSGDKSRNFPYGSGWGMATVNPSLWNEWSDDDMRKRASIADLKAENIPSWSDDQMQNTGYHAKKISSITANRRGMENNNCFLEDCDVFGPMMYHYYDCCGNPMQCGSLQPEILIRYADVLLMLSELTGDATYMNQVRERAGLPSVKYSLAALQEERRHELAFEGVRWNDMRRWGADYCIAALEAQIGQPIENCGAPSVNEAQCGGFRARYEQTGGFWAIPKSAIAASDYNIAQNPGWEVANAYYCGWNVAPGEYVNNPLEVGEWTYAHNVKDGCWGKVTYRTGSATVMKKEPVKGGVIESYTVREMAAMRQGEITGDETQLAYMTFSNGRLSKYDQSGELIGSYAYIYTPDPDGWRLGTMTIEQGGLLYPYSATDVRQIPATFDVLAVNDEYLMLVANDGSLKSGDVTTFWSFRHPNFNEQQWNSLMRDQETHWTYADYEPDPNRYGDSYTCGPVGCWGRLMPRVDNSAVSVFDYWNPVVDRSVMAIDLAEYAQTQKPALRHYGTEQPGAYMVIDMKNMTISKYSPDDYLVNTGHFSVELDEKAGFNGTFGRLVTDPGSVLFPYQYGNEGYLPTEFELVQLQAMSNKFGLLYRPADDPQHPTFWSFAQRNEAAMFTGLNTLVSFGWGWDKSVCSADHMVKFDNDMVVRSFRGKEIIGTGTFQVKHWNPQGNAEGILGILCCPAGALTYDASLYSPTEFKILALDEAHVVLSFEADGKEIVWELMPQMPPAVKMLVGEGGQKSWTFAYDGSPVWGNAGHTGFGYGYDANTIDGFWWGITNADEFSSQLSHAGDDFYNALKDIAPGSYMTFGSDLSVTSYTANGEVIRSATYSISGYEDGARPTGWEMATLQTSAPVVLFPYSINEGGYQVTEFDVMYLDDEHMTLVYTKGNGAGSWGEIGFWRFQSKDSSSR